MFIGSEAAAMPGYDGDNGLNMMWIKITTIFIRSDIVWAGFPDFLFKDKLLASSVCSYLLRWPENTKRLNMMIVFDKGRPRKRRQIRVKG